MTTAKPGSTIPKLTKAPFNVELLQLTPQNTASLKPIKVADIYDGGTSNFNEDGLYSVSIFGTVGTKERSQRFSFIDLKVPVLHPVLFKHIYRLKALYGDILSGRKYAKWDGKQKDFTSSDELEGETGYAFFMTHLPEIKFVETKSSQRTLRINLVKKYIENPTTTKWLVLPAGLRDVQISDDGYPQEDEINDMYRKILAISNAIYVTPGNTNDSAYDRSRFALQIAINEIYEHIESLLTGKKGFIQAKWGSRKIFNGTRNVISSMDVGTDDLDSPRALEASDTALGLYQTAKGALPLVSSWLLNGHLAKLFQGTSTVPLVNKKTKRTVSVNVEVETLDRWSTIEGLEKLINYYGNESIRHNPIVIEDHFLALLYNDGVHFKLLNPGEYESLDANKKMHCAPVTYAELIYLVGYTRWNTLVGIVTRYPITGLGSTYPTTLYVKTTVEADILTELDDDWNPKEDSTAYEFPRNGIPFFDTIGLSPSRLQGLGADHDGDTVSCNVITSDEGMEEVSNFFDSIQGFIDPRGGLQMTGTDTIDWLLRGLTRPLTPST